MDGVLSARNPSVGLAAVTFLLGSYLLNPWSALVLAWIVAVLAWLSLVILMMTQVPATQTAERAQRHEPHSGLMLFITVVVTLASLGTLAYTEAGSQCKQTRRRILPGCAPA